MGKHSKFYSSIIPHCFLEVQYILSPHSPPSMSQSFLPNKWAYYYSLRLLLHWSMKICLKCSSTNKWWCGSRREWGPHGLSPCIPLVSPPLPLSFHVSNVILQTEPIASTWSGLRRRKQHRGDGGHWFFPHMLATKRKMCALVWVTSSFWVFASRWRKAVTDCLVWGRVTWSKV